MQPLRVDDADEGHSAPAWKFWGATCPSPETIDIVWAEAVATVIRETTRTSRNIFLENCIIASSSFLGIQIRQLGTGRGGEISITPWGGEKCQKKRRGASSPPEGLQICQVI